MGSSCTSYFSSLTNPAFFLSKILYPLSNALNSSSSSPGSAFRTCLMIRSRDLSDQQALPDLLLCILPDLYPRFQNLSYELHYSHSPFAAINSFMPKYLSSKAVFHTIYQPGSIPRLAPHICCRMHTSCFQTAERPPVKTIRIAPRIFDFFSSLLCGFIQ